MDSLQRTPLFAFHQRHGARLVPFAGWEMPVQYTGILEEHRAVRTAAGLFDVSHMGEVRFSGKEAAACLDFLVTNDVSRLQVGRGLYTVMCYPEGGIVDDLIIYRTGDEEYLAVINAGNTSKDIAWMQEHAERFDCVFENVSDAYALLALQGPQAANILRRAAGDLPKIERFGIAQIRIGEIPATIARTGYTGEDGFEILVAPEEAESLAEILLREGASAGLRLAGLGARDSLRTEAGYPLYGHELSQEISPLEAGLHWVVKLKKATAFLGKEALSAEKVEGPQRELLWFRLNDRRIAREGAEVYQGDRCVGRITSGTHSPILNCPIGAALVTSSRSDDLPLEVDFRGRRVVLETATPPLHQTC